MSDTQHLRFVVQVSDLDISIYDNAVGGKHVLGSAIVHDSARFNEELQWITEACNTLNAHEAERIAFEREMAKKSDPFHEWRGVPVTIENMDRCGLFEGNGSTINGSYRWYETIGPEGAHIGLRDSGGVAWAGLALDPSDIAHLCETLLCIFPKAFNE